MCKLLSLCVPTYNRSGLLRQSLHAILSQVDTAVAPQVEVLVMDNASPDDTPQVVAELQAQFPDAPVRYVRHPQNIGPDANFLEASRQAEGQYVYLLSDDDVLLPGAVTTLLTLIAAHPTFDAFCLNVHPFQHDIAETTKPAFSLSSDRVLWGRDAALLFLGTHLTFMSSVVFKRANMMDKDYRDKFATNLAQAYMFLDVLWPGQGVYVSHEPGLAQRMDNTGPFDFFKVFVTNFHALMQHSVQIGYSAQTVKEVEARHLRFVRSVAFTFLVSGPLGMRPDFRKAPGRLLQAYGRGPYVVFGILPLVLFPQALARPLFATYRRLKGRFRKPPPRPESSLTATP